MIVGFFSCSLLFLVFLPFCFSDFSEKLARPKVRSLEGSAAHKGLEPELEAWTVYSPIFAFMFSFSCFVGRGWRSPGWVLWKDLSAVSSAASRRAS